MKRVESVNTQVLGNENNCTLPVIDLVISGELITCLIDSGATCSLLDFDIFRHMKINECVKFYKPDVKIMSISGETLEIVDCVSLPITMGSKQFRQKFYIVKNLFSRFYKAILGYDYLRVGKFGICFKTNTLKSGNSVVHFRDALSNKTEIQTHYAYMSQNMILQPGESRSVELSLKNWVKDKQMVKFFPVTKNLDIKFVNSIYPVSNGKSLEVNVKNTSEQAIPMNKNMKVGVINNNFDKRDIEHIKQLRREELKETDFNLDHLDEISKKKLTKLLMEYADVFSKRLYTIGRTEAIQPNLQVDTNNLPSVRPYPIPEALHGEVRKQLTELQNANIIERSNSHVSFPLLLVKKKNPSGNPLNQKYRLVVDYRRLNKHLKYTRYRLPVVQHLLDKLREKKFYTTLDLSASFWQLVLKEKDRDITSFSSPYGNFRFISAPQGLSAVPECMAHLADIILAPLSDLMIANFIDDYAFGADSLDEMLYKLRLLLDRFRTFGITVNPEKCSFMLPEIKFLGHKLNSTGIQPLEDNIIKIQNFPVPNTVKKIRRFVGLVSYYRKFIEHFSELTLPLTELTKKNARYKWNSIAQNSFELLKDRLSKPPILIHPNYEQEFILSADASNYILGGVLGHNDENEIFRPIAYFSKKLNPTQIKYTILEKELMAIVECVKCFKHYLYGRKFLIRCDNKSLTEMSKLESPSNRVTRWFTFLSDYNYTFKHVPSSENIIADILSRDFHDNAADKKGASIHSQNTTNNESLKKINVVEKQQNDIVIHSNDEENSNTNHYLKESESNLLATGLVNIGNSCFINVVLQGLTYLKPLLQILSNDKHNCTNKTFCIVCAFQRHLDLVSTNKEKKICPLEFCENLKHIGPQFRELHQADAHDFLHQVINRFENDIPTHSFPNYQEIGNRNINPIKSLFEGNFQNTVECLKCNKRSINFDPFKDISLNIEQQNDSLEDSLERFTQSERLVDKHRCVHCKINTDTNKIMTVSKAPKILTISFKRFEYLKSETHKIATYISYPEKLNFRPYMTNWNSNKPIWYTLNSVIIHSGNITTQGHYFCYNRNTNGNWYSMNDEVITEASLKEVLNQQAYILIYVHCEEPTDILVNGTNIVNTVQVDLPTIEEIKIAQKKDEELSLIISALNNNITEISQKYADYFIKDDLLLHRTYLPRIRKTKAVERIVVPKIFRAHILTVKHFCHFGLVKTYNLIREKYYWENLYADTKHFVKSCKQCAAHRSPNKLPPLPVQDNYIPSRVNEFISSDFIGPFHTTDRGNQYIFTIIDHFSKFVKLYALPNANAKCVIDSLMDYMGTFGIPSYFLTDNARCFRSEIVEQLCKRFSVTKLFPTAQHPSGNGASEKLNSNIKKALAIFAEETGNWDDYLDYYALIYNNSIHSTVNEKPSFLQLGYDPKLPTDLLNEQTPITYNSYKDFAEKKALQLKFVYKKVKENLIAAAKKQQNYQHQFAKYRNFSIGDKVFLHNKDLDRHKLTTKKRQNEGPFEITKIHNKVDFSIRDPFKHDAKTIKVHAQRLLPYTSRKPELDYFYSENKNPRHSNADASNILYSKTPHPQFEDKQNIDFLWAAPLYNTAKPHIEKQNEIVSSNPAVINDTESLIQNNEVVGDTPIPEERELTVNNEEVINTPMGEEIELPDTDNSNNTIIYTPPHNLVTNLHDYNLRTLSPRYDPQRFLQWAFKLTE